MIRFKLCFEIQATHAVISKARLMIKKSILNTKKKLIHMSDVLVVYRESRRPI